MVENLNNTGDPIKGGTSTNVDKTPLWDVNSAHIKKRTEKYNEHLTNFVTDAFRTTGTLPRINGKPIGSLDELSKYVGQYGQQLYDQAIKVYDNPDLEISSAKFLMAKQKKVDDAFGYLAQANNILSQDLLNAAKHMDAKIKVKGIHTILLGPNGEIKSPTQAKKDIDAFRAEQINKEMEAWKKTNPEPVNSSMFMQRTDMANPMAGKWFRDIDGQIKQMDSRPKMQNSQEGYRMLENLQFENISNKYKNYNYDDIYRRVFEEYNKNGKTRKIKAAEEGLFNDNAGGAKTAASKQEISFDVDNFYDYDANQVMPEMKYTIDFLKKVNENQEGVFFRTGDLNTNTSIPTGSDVEAKKVFSQIFTDLRSNTTNPNQSRTGAQSRLHGSLVFQPMASGDENYHVYHLKVHPAYLKQYKAGESDVDNEEKEVTEGFGLISKDSKLVNNGITVFVPIEQAQKMGIEISKQSLKGTKISPVEGQISLSGDNSMTRTIPNGGTYKIALDKKTNQYFVSGNFVVYNPSTAKMDTTTINELGIKSNWDMSTDLEKLDNDLFMLGLRYFEDNAVEKRKDSKLRGVKDPKQLSGN
jgi:hypothetical protein